MQEMHSLVELPALVSSQSTPLSVETTNHVIELYEGCLTIGTKSFPDDCISLSEDETLQILQFLSRLQSPSL